MKYILLTGLTLLFSVSGYCQTEGHAYYFDKDFRITTPAEAVFNGIGITEGRAWLLKCYNKKDKTLIFKMRFTDSTLSVRNGLFQSFYADNSLKNIGNYLQDKQIGLWKRWNEYGNLVDSSLYENGNAVMNTTLDYYPNKIKQSVIINDIRQRRVYRTFYGMDGKIEISDTLDNLSHNLSRIDNSPDENKVFVKTEIEASFPGGEQAWTRYITQVIRKNIDDLNDDNKSGTCRVRFIVDKQGNVLGTVALTMTGSVLARIVVDAIAHGPKWTPAQQNGRFVTAFKEQPVTFAIQSP